MIPITALTALAAYIVSAAAHGGITSMSIGSTTYPGWAPFNPPAGQVSAERPYSSYNPILDPLDPTLHCNDNGQGSGAGQQSITIAAGQTLVGHWPQWTHAEGPVTVYLASCPGSDCNSVNSASVKWFKIAEQGLISGTVGKGSWANGILMANLAWPATIPANLKPGPYLIRYETLALHQANTPQFYPECIQLIVTGSGTTFPTADYLVSIPGAWGAHDPGIDIDIYSTAAQTQTTYQIPGPPIYPGFSGGSTNPPSTVVPPPTTVNGPSTTKTSTTSSSSKTSSTSSKPPTSSPPPVGTVPQYGQCGGQGWSGGTVCVAPYTCKVSNAYYSQCL